MLRIISYVCLGIGIIWLHHNTLTRKQILRELDIMRQPGIAGNPPTPEGMKRIARSETDLEMSKVRRVIAICLTIFGIGSFLFSILSE